jgi:hypothetical protein
MREIHRVAEKKLFGFSPPMEVRTFVRQYNYDIDALKRRIANGRQVQCTDKGGAWIPDREALNYFEDILEAEITEFRACKTVEDYKTYLETYPNSIFSQDAEAKVREVEKEETEFRKLRNIQHYQAFVERYPSSPLRDKANEQIEALKQEEEDFRLCRGVEDYQAYLEKYPDGLRRKEARDKIIELEGR